MKRRLFPDAPILPVAVIVIIGIALFFPSNFQEPDIPFISRAADNMLHLRSHLLLQYREAGLSDEAYAILAAMTLGDKSALTPEIRESFNITGASHILALSGLHLSIIYMMLTLLVPSRRWRMVSQTLTILAIWAFALLTGLSPSVVRAATMLTVYGLLSIGYREKMSVNVLAFTAVIMLIASPTSLYKVSFQMSFLAVLGILLFNPLLTNLIPAHVLQRHTLLKWLWGMTTVSISAQIGVAPLIVFYFHRFSTYFLLSNFVVVPCAYLLIIGCLLLLVTQFTPVATILASIVSLMTNALGKIASLPFANIDHLTPNIVQIALIYVIIACIYIFFRTFAKIKHYKT